MKQILVCLSVSLFSISIHAQSITLNDLIKVSTLDQDEIRLFMQKKGYTYEGFTEKSEKYVFSLNFLSADEKSVLTYQVRENQNVSILFLTLEKNYLSIKETAKSNNYIKGETFVVQDKTCTEYKNKYYIFSFCTSNGDTMDFKIHLERVVL